MTVPGTNPTILVPGFFGGNALFGPFRSLLRSRGVAAEYWSRSPFLYSLSIDWYGARLSADLLNHHKATGQAITGVGWSEGGLVLVSALQHLSVGGHDPSRIIRRVITYGSPFVGTWAARPTALVDLLLRTSIREMRPGSRTLVEQVAFLHKPRKWKFHALYGKHDWLVRPVRHGLDPDWCQEGPWDHRSLLWHPELFRVIHRLIELP